MVIYIWYWVILITNIWSVVSSLISQHPTDAFTNMLYLLSIYKDLWLQYGPFYLGLYVHGQDRNHNAVHHIVALLVNGLLMVFVTIWI